MKVDGSKKPMSNSVKLKFSDFVNTEMILIASACEKDNERK